MKTDKKHHKASKSSSSRVRWLVTIFLLVLVISAAFSFMSQELLNSASLFGAFVVLLAIIAIGILFDLLGVAVTAADEKPFHSMAARKVVGAAEAIHLLRNAGKVSTICCDVVGDICGIISGTAAAVVAMEAFIHFDALPFTVLQLLLSALVAALTICGGDVQAAAERLGISRATLYRRMKKLDINTKSLKNSSHHDG